MKDAPLHLTRHDADINMARFYRLDVQPSLFGEWVVVRHWGRIGTAGRQMLATHADEASAWQAMDRLGAAKLRRGYQPG